MFGNYLKNASNCLKASNNQMLSTCNTSINNFLSGGFQRGKIYELQGPSLSGKSHFLKSLIENNMNINSNNIMNNNIPKILFIDTNSSFSIEKFEKTESNKNIPKNLETPSLITINYNIKHIDHIFDFMELYHYLYSLYTKSQLHEVAFIFIDSLSLIANKLNLSKDDELIKEFNNLILSIVEKYTIGIIYTSSSYKTRDKVLYDFSKTEENKTLLFKETESNLHSNVIFLPDYSLFFMSQNYSYTLNAFKNRKYYVKIKKEKGHPVDQLFEL